MTHVYYGRVRSITYENTPSSFYIMKMALDGSGESINVKGTVAGVTVKVGSWFGFEAKRSNHPKYGEQYEITRAPVLDTWDDDKAFRALVANDVSEMYLTKIRANAGPEFLDVLSDLDALKTVENVPLHVAMHVHERWQFCKAYYQTFDLLNQLNVPAALYNQVWGMFGDRTQEVLTTDPWELVAIEGITFPLIDQIAYALHIPLDSPSRVRGVILHALKSNRDFGHLYVDLPTLTDRVLGIADNLEANMIGTGLVELHKAGKIVVDRKTRPGTTAIYEIWNHKSEVGSAQLIKDRLVSAAWDQGDAKDAYVNHLKMALTTPPEDGVDVPVDDLTQQVVTQWSKANNIDLTHFQEQGIVNALRHPVSVITGLPGTGKTTSLRLLVRALQAAQLNFLLVAPTGIAAKRLYNVTGTKASTIHRAFGSKGVDQSGERKAAYEGILEESPSGKAQRISEDWAYGPGNAHPAQYVIVDESSMVDQALLYRLLSCTDEKCRLVLVGDAAQLPSVGPGNVLRDLIASGLVPTTALTEIFRQGNVSDIVVAAHQIHNDQVPDVQMTDFNLTEIEYEDEVLRHILAKAQELELQKVNYQIISPRHGGLVGVTNLNTQLRELLNPKGDGKSEISLGSSTIRQGDRVMVVKNNYEFGVFNGDLGRIMRIDHSAKEIVVDIDGPTALTVKFPFKEGMALLRMAYATTVHKCQGQEWDQIVMPVIPAFRHQLQRNLLYTAITRARERVMLVGSASSVTTAVHNDKEAARNTLFVDRLTPPNS
jgi:exodeoxyribonuclease V alpha subunit